MAFKSYPFSSAIISYKHLSLLNKDNILTAAGSDTADAAMMALKEKGYAAGAPELDNPYAFESTVAYELKQSIAFLKDVTPEATLLNLYLLKYDYLNVKTLLKLNLLGAEFTEKDISPYGSIAFDVLKESIANQAYSRLPREMAQTMRHLDKAFAINEDATIIGFAMDKAYSAHVNRLLKGVKNPLVHDYFKAYFDFTNMMVVLRLKQAGYNADVLDEALLAGGRLHAQELQKAFEDKSDGVVNYFYKYGYQAYLKGPFEKLQSGGGLFAIEKARDDYLLNVIKRDKYDMFSSSRAVGFLLAKEREAAAVRLLMVGMLNHISTEEIGKRLKDLYL